LNTALETLISAWLGPGLLVLSRALGLAVTAPGWSAAGLGARGRLGLAGLVAALLAPAVAVELRGAVPGVGDPAALARWCLAEAAVGAGIGLAMGLVLAGARLAGDLLGAQAGLSPASLLDPEAGSDLTPLGHLHGLVALGVFLALDGPLRLVGALVESYHAVPAGGLPLSAESAARAFERVGWALSLALRAAAPAGVALLAAGLALGLVAKAAGGAAPLGGLAMPARVALGLVLALAGLAAAAGAFGAAWSSVLTF
jgi:flagellar biosynthetic protein FliR